MNIIKFAYQKLGLSKKQFWVLFLFCLIALGHNFLANDKYLIAKTDSGIGFFAEAKKAKYGVKALVPYSSDSIDKKNRKVSPFESQNVSSLYYRHWLGTDNIGRDVLAGLINGSYIALLVGFFSAIIALLLGIFFGFLSGYYGDNGVQLSKLGIALWLITTIISWFYSFYLNGIMTFFLFFFPLIVLMFLVKNTSGSKGRSGVYFPFDTIIFRIIEVFNSIPSLFIMLILLAIIGKPSIFSIVVIIGILRGPNVARHLRAEVLKLKQEQYIDSARSIGQSDVKIFLYHVLPMAASPLIIVSAFGFASAILLESTLSFLGIGISAEIVTWGSLIKEARFNFDAWWLAIFPGLSIYGLIYLFNSIGDNINNKIRGI